MAELKTRIFGWHSFKGGSGRSLGLANVAYELASRGRRVLCVDMDLESCGLATIFDVEIDDRPGTTEVLIQGRYPVLKSAICPVGKVRGWDCYIDLIASKHEPPEQLMKLRWTEALAGFGNVLVDTYASAEKIDYIFLDSRGGISEQLAASLLLPTDGVIVFTRADRQSRVGTLHLLETIRRLAPRPLTPLIVMNGVPAGPDGDGAIADLRARLLLKAMNEVTMLTTPFDPSLLLIEEIVTRTRKSGPDPLRMAYNAVADWIEGGARP